VCYQKAFLVTERKWVVRAYKRARSHVYRCRSCYNSAHRKPILGHPRPHRCGRCRLPDGIVLFSPRGKGLAGYCKRCRCERAKLKRSGTA
jgi:hypothetical protein